MMRADRTFPWELVPLVLVLLSVLVVVALT